jgi:hypothetical protein
VITFVTCLITALAAIAEHPVVGTGITAVGALISVLIAPLCPVAEHPVVGTGAAAALTDIVHTGLNPIAV